INKPVKETTTRSEVEKCSHDKLSDWSLLFKSLITVKVVTAGTLPAAKINKPVEETTTRSEVEKCSHDKLPHWSLLFKSLITVKVVTAGDLPAASL
ncbi:hypothetical protein J6590_098149, partial [Homalodisca vitripennis]